MTYPMWNESKTGILIDRGNAILAFVDVGPEFDALIGVASDWHEYEISTKAPPTIEDRRKEMVCLAPQLRVYLIRIGRILDVQSIADADLVTSAIWEYSPTFSRMSPMAIAMEGQGGFSPEELDAIFTGAMGVSV